jgi:hypothetical protein
MEIKKVLAHTCFQRGKGLAKDAPLSPKKCRCRQYVSVAEAEAEIKLGLAQHVVASEKTVEYSEACPICTADEVLIKFCDMCKNTGLVKVKRIVPILGADIIRTVSHDGKKNTLTTQVKKSPTIEKAHIERAYVDGNEIEQLRIEIYGASIKDFIQSLVVGEEPVDDPRTGTGRTFDYGRTV